MIDVVQPVVEPVLGHHGAEVLPLVQLLAAGSVGFSMIVLAVRGAILGFGARARSAAMRGTVVPAERRESGDEGG